jgi:hypothetical protein
MKHGRWLQRDPLGFIDGPNLYEAFGGNSLVNVDPMGKQGFGYMNGYPADEWVRMHKESSTFARPPADPEEVKDLAKTAAVSTLNVVPYAFGIVPGIIVNVVTLSMVAPTAYYARDAQFVATTGEHLAADQAIAIVFFDLTQISTGSMILTGEDFLTVQGVDPTTREKAATHLAVGLICGLGTAKSLSPVRSGVYGAEPVLLDTMARVAPNSPKVQSFFLRQALEIGARDYAAQTPGAAQLAAADLFTSGAGIRPTQLAMNIAAGQNLEIAAQAWAAAQGETLLQTQFRQGAVLRGIDFGSFVTTPEGGAQLFLNEASSTQGLRAPGSLTALGMGRGGQQVFQKNLFMVQEAILAQIPAGPLQRALLSELQSGGTIRLIGPSGFGVTSQGLTRIQATTNRPVVVLIVPPTAP